MSEPSERIGPYRVVAELGRGAMGVVHLALDPSGQEIAVKSIGSDDAQLGARLLREATVRITHPNVVRIFGAGLDARGRPYVAMERLVGRSLAAHFASGLCAADVIALVTQAAEGVGALHERGIVHRDIKPANLFVTEDGVVKVLDFGAAVVHEAASLLTLAGALVGTPSYLSPEQARGESDVDARADVWALGVVLFEGLSGMRPFERTNPLATVLAVLDPHTAAPTLPGEDAALAALVASCLSKDRRARPASARALAESLRALPVPHPASGAPPLSLGTIVTLRRIAVVLVDQAEDRAELQRLAERARGTFVPLLARAAAITFGLDVARGDELPVAVRFALEIAPRVGRAVVTTARVRSAADSLDPIALAEGQALLGLGVHGVLVSTEVVDLLGSSLRTERIGEGAVRVLGWLDRASDLDVAGRDAECRRLGRVFDRVVSGEGPRLCSIVGPPGIGKTALVRLFIERARRETADLVVVETVAQHAESAPFAALSEALGVVQAERDESGEVQATVDRRRARVIDALSGLVEQGPVVALIFEDLQWLDVASRAIASELTELFEQRRLMVIVTSREPIADLRADETIELAPLRTADVADIATRILARPVSAAFAAELAARSGGNPLFVEQLLRHAQARANDEGVTTGSLPATIESAVQAQIDSLDAELRDALMKLSVIGPEMDPAHALHALGRLSNVLVARLVDADVLERGHRGGRPVVFFKSRLVAEVAYGLFDPADAARLHREIATRLAAQPDPPAELVSRHASRGGDVALAARHARIALREAARVGDSATALSHLELALRDATPEETFDVTFRAAECAPFVEGPRRHTQLLERALELATSADMRAVVETELAERLRRDGANAEARRRLEHVLGHALDPVTRVHASCRYALVLVSQGETARAAELLVAPDVELPAATAALLASTQGYVFGALGVLGARRRAYERAGVIFADTGNLRRSVGALTNLGDTMLRMGAIEDAERTLRKAVDGARRVGSPLLEAYARANLGVALGQLDRGREAVAVLDTAIRIAGRLDDLRLESVARLYRARITKDAPPAALRVVVEASREDPMRHALALAVLLESGHAEAAIVEEALELARRGVELEEGLLDLCRALATRVPLDVVAAISTPYLDRTLASIDEPSWAEQFVAHVRRHYPSLAERWLAARR